MHVLTILLVFLSVGIITGFTFIDKNKNVYHDGYALIPDEKGFLHFINLTVPTNIDVDVSPEDFNAYFYSPTHPNEGRRLSASTFNGSIGEGFYPSLKSIFCAHGWMSENTSDSCVKVRLAMTQHGGMNVFVIDYKRIAYEFYPISAIALAKLGQICGNFIDTMLEYYKLNSKRVLLIGASLGSQLTGYCSKHMRKIPGEIVGLDPAKPLFSANDPENCLTREDADVVHVIHTNKGLLGIASSIGHADFYANGGGIDQPGCGMDLFGFCAHNRAAEYYSESIVSSIGFKSQQCNSYEDFTRGECKNNPITFAGGADLDETASGDYYFNTNAKSPFATPICCNN